MKDPSQSMPVLTMLAVPTIRNGRLSLLMSRSSRYETGSQAKGGDRA